ncbi:MAG: deoxyribodipyrimidine photo-lyase [candidate division Zixibacteria bacterium]|nr:deoxyribodipyrimidine photo-lyase [candidate division Zixibacteria bacterium]
MVNPKRVRKLNQVKADSLPVVYWMSRDQRVDDNWALLYAQELANKFKVSLAVVFCLNPEFLDATLGQYDFMLRGLQQVEKQIEKFDIPFFMLTGKPTIEIPKFLNQHKAGHLVCDFSPLRINRQWQQDIVDNVECSVYEVDAHNIIPCWHASDKLEYAAYTIRPKIHKMLPEFLEEFPSLEKHKYSWDKEANNVNWEKARTTLKIDENVLPVGWLNPGADEAHERMYDFLQNRLSSYDSNRNDPTLNYQSQLSPYLHFGQLSAQRVALEAHKYDDDIASQEAFLEELIVRRELADNFCFYNPDYDNFNGFPAWARKTLDEHRNDSRDNLYSRNGFEQAQTHDPLWNAAQLEMVYTGKMHGYMRMYWAKKILEWTESPEVAMEIAIYLNDKYELDGRDPNGYAGVAWSIGGIHDRAWSERDVFGKIRYMSYNGCKRKFKVDGYIEKIRDLAEGQT